MPLAVVQALVERGHDVVDIRQTAREGSPDEEIWRIAQCEKRLLLTTDKDFRVYRATSPHVGILIVCLRRPSGASLTRRFLDLLDRFEPSGWVNTTVMARDSAAVVWTSWSPM